MPGNRDEYEPRTSRTVLVQTEHGRYQASVPNDRKKTVRLLMLIKTTIALLMAYLSHGVQLMVFRHDGTGLRSISTWHAVWLVVLATMLSIAENHNIPGKVIAGAILLACIRMFGRPLVAALALIAINTDLAVAVCHALSLPSGGVGLWSLAAQGVMLWRLHATVSNRQ